MGTGQSFVKWLRPAGCALFLGLFVLVTIFLFTTKGLTVEGYTPPETSSYYASHAEELAEELRENMFPLLDVEWADARVQDGKVVVTAGEDDLNTVRLSVIHYYDKKLFKFTEREAS